MGSADTPTPGGVERSLGVLNEATGSGGCRTVPGTQHGSVNVCLIQMEGLL